MEKKLSRKVSNPKNNRKIVYKKNVLKLFLEKIPAK